VKEKKRLRVKKLGRLEYGAALQLQKETELAVRDGGQPDTLLLLEHPHTLTVGRRGDNAGILTSPVDPTLLAAYAAQSAVSAPVPASQ